MADWILNCPVCGATNQVPADELDLACGTVSCTCTCENCGNEFSAEQPYWHWLGLETGPPAKEEE
jgi:hypothetical protein